MTNVVLVPSRSSGIFLACNCRAVNSFPACLFALKKRVEFYERIESRESRAAVANVAQRAERYFGLPRQFLKAALICPQEFAGPNQYVCIHEANYGHDLPFPSSKESLERNNACKIIQGVIQCPIHSKSQGEIMNDSTTKPTDAELLEQLADAVYRRECSATYACQQSYKLGLAQGRLEGAQIAASRVVTSCENVKVTP